MNLTWKSNKVLWVVALIVAVLCLVGVALAQPPLQVTYYPAQLMQSSRVDREKMAGIYPTEVDPKGVTFNWVSPSATFMFDFESTRPLKLNIEIRSAALAGGPDKPVAVLVNDLHIGELHPNPDNPDFQSFSLKFIPVSVRSTEPSDQFPLKIKLLSSSFKPSMVDNRELGTMIRSITIDREEAWSAIGKRMWLYWLLPIVAGLACTLYWIARRYRIALFGYVASLLCLGGMALMAVAIMLLLSIGVIDLLTFPVFLICSIYLGVLFAIAGGVMAWRLPSSRKFSTQVYSYLKGDSSHFQLGYLRRAYNILWYCKKLIMFPEKVFLVIGLFFGTLFAIIIPPFQVPDEFAHFARAYDILEGHLITEKLFVDVPASSLAFNQATEYLKFQPEQKISPLILISSLGLPLNQAEKTSFLTNAAGYPPVSYIPEALGMAIGSVFNSSPAVMLYLGRFANLFVSVFLIFFAIKITPFYKWVFLAFSLTPMIFQQMASLSADSFTNSIDLLFLAIILAYTFDTERKFTNKTFLILILLAILVVLSKQAYFMLLLLFFLIPIKKVGSLKKYITMGVLILVTGLGSLVIWSLISSGLSFSTVHAQEISPKDQVSYILSNPIDYFQIFLDNFTRRAKDLLDLAFGSKLGWLDTPLNPFLIFFIEAFLFLLALTDKNRTIRFNKFHRMAILVVALLLIFSIFSTSYIALNPFAAKDLTALQGRYFIPVIPILLLLFYNQRINFNITTLKRGLLVSCCSIAILILTLNTLINRYYADVFTEDKVIVGIYNGFLTDEVLPNNPIVQDFKCSVRNLKDLSILAGPDEGRDSKTGFDLVLMEGSTQIFRYEMTAYELNNNKWFSVALPKPLEDCGGRTLSLRIESKEATPGSGLKFWSYEKYYEGNLFGNDSALAGKSIGLVLNGHSNAIL